MVTIPYVEEHQILYLVQEMAGLSPQIGYRIIITVIKVEISIFFSSHVLWLLLMQNVGYATMK